MIDFFGRQSDLMDLKLLAVVIECPECRMGVYNSKTILKCFNKNTYISFS
jgi:hypothetical protein